MIVDHGGLSALRHELAANTVALRFGTFDVLHPGHDDAIDFSASQADTLVVGIMHDSIVRSRKGPGRPVNSAIARADAVSKRPGVDCVFITPSRAVLLAHAVIRLRPDVYVEHEEFGPDPKKAAFLRLFGINYVIDHGQKENSTTAILAARQVEANTGACGIVGSARPSSSG